MKKKILLFLALTVTLISSSFVMFACGENTKNPYLEIKTFVEDVVSNNSDYEVSSVMGTEFSCYKVKGLQYKKEDNSLVEDGDEYNAIFAISMNKIIKYYPEIENIKASRLGALVKSFNNLKLSKENFNDARKRFLALEASANYSVYNGYYARYKQEVMKYIDSTCDFAKELILTREKNLKPIKNASEEEVSEFNALQGIITYDSQIIKALGDIKDFMFISAKGKVVETNLYSDSKDILKKLASLATNTTFEVKEENKEAFINLSSALENQRSIVSQAVRNFSVYDLVQSYEGSLYMYYKTDATKEFDFTQLCAYYLSDGYLIKFLNNLNSYTI